MERVKRVEIVTLSVEVPKLKELLARLKVPGYTILPHAEGFGDRGERAGDDLTGVTRNSYILVACDEETAQRLAEEVRPVLRRFGGICLIGDAFSVRIPKKKPQGGSC